MTLPRVAVEALGAGEIHVWHLPIDGSAIPRLSELLAPDERERAVRFAFDRDRHQFVATRAWLRLLLSRYLEQSPERIGFVPGPQGKPAIPDGPPLHFNVSHSGSRALLAFAPDRELGADVEAVTAARDLPDLAASCFSTAELAVYRRDGRPETFYRFWTGKEAYIKAVGGGLSIPLQDFSVGLDREATRSIAITRDPALPALAVEWLPAVPGYQAAVAAAGTDWRVRLFELP